MSDAQFQEALADYIRSANQAPHPVESYFEKYDLDRDEQILLKKMSQDPYVNKYGILMSKVRREEALKKMPLSKTAIKPAVLDELYFRHFEPTAKHLHHQATGYDFIEFLVAKEGKPLLEKLSMLAQDYLTYEYARAFIHRREKEEIASKLPKGSLLAHDSLLVIELNHDVTDFVTRKLQGEKVETPTQRKLIQLWVLCDESPRCRTFEIDEELKVFLEHQTTDPTLSSTKPSAYGDLVSLGLCRPDN